MTTKHTPTPWGRNIRAEGKYPVIFAGRNQHVTTVCQQSNPDETEANIDFIVLACNNHARLVSWLEKLESLMDKNGYFVGGLSPNEASELRNFLADM